MAVFEYGLELPGGVKNAAMWLHRMDLSLCGQTVNFAPIDAEPMTRGDERQQFIDAIRFSDVIKWLHP